MGLKVSKNKNDGGNLITIRLNPGGNNVKVSNLIRLSKLKKIASNKCKIPLRDIDLTIFDENGQ